MNRGQSSARAKSPRKSSHKRGAFKLTPARVKARTKAALYEPPQFIAFEDR